MTRSVRRMTAKEFAALSNYSCTNPTGVIVGKEWKRAKDYYNQTDDAKDWWHCQYVYHDAEHCKIVVSEIEILNENQELIRNRLFGK